MSEAATAKRTQTVKRSALTTIVNKITTALEAETCPTLQTLQRFLLEARKRVTDVDESHTAVLITCELEDEALDELSQGQETWLEPKHQVLEKLEERIKTLGPVPNGQMQPNETPDAGGAATAGGDSGATHSTAKILKLRLSVFDGTDPDAFPDWESEIRTHVGNSPNYDAATKIGLLRQYTEKIPNEMIAGLPLTKIGYDTAFDLLCKRYGRPSRIAYRHVKALIGLEPLKSRGGQTHVAGLYNMYTNITRHLRGLANIKDNMRVEDILLPLIISKFPTPMQHELAKTHPDLDAVDLQELLTFIEGEVQRYEFISDFHTTNNTNTGVDKAVSSTHNTGGSVTALQVNADTPAPSSEPLQGGNGAAKRDGGKCDYCKQLHATRTCPRFWKADKAKRRELINKACLCSRCLKRGHSPSSCSACCRACGGPHAKPICPTSASHMTHQNPPPRPQGIPYQWSGQTPAAGYNATVAGGPPRFTPPQAPHYHHPASAGAPAAPPSHLGYTLPAHTSTTHHSGYNINNNNNNALSLSYPQVQQPSDFRRVALDARPPENGRTFPL